MHLRLRFTRDLGRSGGCLCWKRGEPLWGRVLRDSLLVTEEEKPLWGRRAMLCVLFDLGLPSLGAADTSAGYSVVGALLFHAGQLMAPLPSLTQLMPSVATTKMTS